MTQTPLTSDILFTRGKKNIPPSALLVRNQNDNYDIVLSDRNAIAPRSIITSDVIKERIYFYCIARSQVTLRLIVEGVGQAVKTGRRNACGNMIAQHESASRQKPCCQRALS